MVDRINSKPSSAPEEFQRNHSFDRRRSVSLAPSDEVIAALANAPENRRARQVSEWESLRRHNLHASRVA
ncbi:MAG: hypothetical protein JO053_03995 [Acidobacteria bacterium]|nr:hypothetical protein [Acidobacteriota bacterium]